MSTAKITLIGMQRFLEHDDLNILTGAEFPSGIDTDILIPAIMLRGGEFEVLYPELDIWQLFVQAWAAKWYRTFDKWINALNIEYEPLYNYDRTESWTTTDEGSDLTTRNITDLETRNLANGQTRALTTSQDSNIEDSTTGTSTDTVSAYNSSAFENDKKNDTTTSGTTDSTSSGSENETTSGTDTGTVTNAGTGTVKLDRSNENVRTGRAYGNIGVTTSQQMLQAELDIAEWNMYEHIADLFIAEFCIPVY